ncbi:MAG: hypothetical protein M3138_05300 [Actinomycetota bacterium]|nr:hypothetical protein [Actinomycetota bacterium]
MNATCFRCDWIGETGDAACPFCAAPLYRPPARAQERGAPRSPPPAMEVEGSEHEAVAPASEGRPVTTSPGAVLLIAGAVFSLVAFLLARGDLDPAPGPVVSPSPVVEETGGRLIYTVPVGDGMARVWRWNLLTDRVAKGPLIRKPVSLVNIRSAGHGWLGVTSDAGGGERKASFLDSLDSDAAAESIGRGDIVTWTREGGTVLLVDRGPLLDRCRRVVDVTAVNVEQRRRETVLHDTICGDVLSVGRTSLGYLLTIVGEHGVDVVGAGYEDAGVLLRDHGVIDVSPGGQMLVTPGTEFLSEPFSDEGSDAPPLRVSGSALRYRLFGGPPVDLFADAAPLRIERVLAYRDGGTRALVVGSQGPDGAALWEVPLTIAGSAPGIPRYIVGVHGFTAAAYANDGTAFVMTDTRLWHLRDHRLTALDVPEGAPSPTGPLAWIVQEPVTEL